MDEGLPYLVHKPSSNESERTQSDNPRQERETAAPKVPSNESERMFTVRSKVYMSLQ